MTNRLRDFQDQIRRHIAATTPVTPYECGYDAGVNGADTTNAHFSCFATQESTREWERGKADGERDKGRLS